MYFSITASVLEFPVAGTAAKSATGTGTNVQDTSFTASGMYLNTDN